MTTPIDGWSRPIRRRTRPEAQAHAADRDVVDTFFDASGEIDDQAFWRWIDEQRQLSIAEYGPTVGENLMLAMLHQIGGIEEYRERYELPDDDTC